MATKKQIVSVLKRILANYIAKANYADTNMDKEKIDALSTAIKLLNPKRTRKKKINGKQTKENNH